MKTEKIILEFIRKEYSDLEIARINGLVKTGETEWSFRFTYRDGDYLSVSKLIKIKFDEEEKNITFVGNHKIRKTEKDSLKHTVKK